VRMGSDEDALGTDDLTTHTLPLAIKVVLQP
jgi:hypothetical protein